MPLSALGQHEKRTCDSKVVILVPIIISDRNTHFSHNVWSYLFNERLCRSGQEGILEGTLIADFKIMCQNFA